MPDAGDLSRRVGLRSQYRSLRGLNWMVILILTLSLTIGSVGAVVQNQAPEAAFDYSPGTPSPDETVTFDASSSSDADGEITEYRWYVDGRRQYNDSPTLNYAFETGGTYEVELVVTDDNGTEDRVTKTVTVENTPPEPIYVYDPNEPSPDETVQFDASRSNDPDGEITGYRWYVDGRRQYNDSPTLSYAFDTGGTYEVELVVEDNGNTERSLTQQITVDNTPPEPSFSYAPIPPTPDETITFDAGDSSDPDGEITEYRWYVDGRRQYNDSPTLTYAFETGGTYQVKLTVVDNGNVERSDTRRVTVENTAPNPKFRFTPESPAPDQTVAFDASQSADPDGEITEYRWYVDGRRQYNDSPTLNYSFDQERTYEVELVVVDNGEVSSATARSVNVTNLAPTAAFDTNPDILVTGRPVTFDGTVSSDPDGSVATYRWRVDDESVSRDGRLDVTFSQAGTYLVELTVGDNAGKPDTVTREVYVTARPTPELEITDGPLAVDRPVTFDASASTDEDGEIVSYSWRIGGVEVGSGPTLQRQFSEPGTYNATLTLTDDSGATTTVTRSVTVYPVPDAALELNATSVLRGETVAVDATAELQNVSYEWEFTGEGDLNLTGTSGTVQFDETGTQTIHLTVTSPAGVTETLERTVTVGPALNTTTRGPSGPIVIGNRTNVTYVLTNHRDVPAKVNVSLRLGDSMTVWQVNGARLASETTLETVTVPPSSERRITLQLNPDAVGKSEVGASLSYRYPDGTAFERDLTPVTITVQQKTTETPMASPTSEPATGRSSGSGPGFGMSALLVALLVCGGLLGVRVRGP